LAQERISRAKTYDERPRSYFERLTFHTAAMMLVRLKDLARMEIKRQRFRAFDKAVSSGKQ